MSSAVDSTHQSGTWFALLHRYRAYLLVAFWCLAFTATHVPAVPMPGAFSWEDKVVHAVTFAVLASLLLWLLSERQISVARRALLVLGIILCYALFDETTQPLVGRYRDVLDATADFFGASCVVLLWAFHRMLYGRRDSDAVPHG